MLSSKKFSRLFIILIVILLGALAFLFRDQILFAMGDFLIITDPLKPVDVIHVIAGDDLRTDYAIQLYKRGYAKYIFFTGGRCPNHDWEHGAHGRQLALEQGIPSEAIFIDDSTVTSTYSETVRLQLWMDHHLTQSVMVVTDPFHTRRARWTYRRILGNKVEIIMAPVPFDQTPYQRQWWKDEYSRDYVKNEYLKSVYYVLRYQLTWGYLKDWLATLDRD
jgi:uncharacterized SAM-binding protein YcdF (DUF218 family)